VEKDFCSSWNDEIVASYLISCILHVPARSSNRCAVQMIEPSSPLPAHPRAAPGKEKVGGSLGFSRNRVVGRSCVA
jgi:hypothetical protein